MRNPIVYVPQETMRLNRQTGEMESKFDLTPAAAFGTLKVVVNSPNTSLMTHHAVKHIRSQLRDYTDRDYILGTGSPATMMMVAMVAATINDGRVKLLQWDQRAKNYIVLEVDALGRNND